jgi:hypothetical protein
MASSAGLRTTRPSIRFTDEYGSYRKATMAQKRALIYYTGIGAGQRQFFTARSFRAMIGASTDLQAIITKHDTRGRDYTDIPDATICDIIGATFLNK